MKIRCTVEVYGDQSFEAQQPFGNMRFSQENEIRANSFEDVAKIMSAFHELFSKLSSKGVKVG